MLGPGARRQVVDVLAVFEAEFLRRLDDRLASRRPLAHRRGRQKTGVAVVLAVLALPALGLLEIGQDVVPAPAAIAELRPMVEILGLSADIDQPVDRRRAAEHSAARIRDCPPGGAGVGFGLEPPGQRRVVEQFHEPDRDMDQRVPVAPAGLDEDDPHRRVLGQPVREDASGRAGADDHVICLHPVPLSAPMDHPAGVGGDLRRVLAAKDRRRPAGMPARPQRSNRTEARQRTAWPMNLAGIGSPQGPFSSCLPTRLGGMLALSTSVSAQCSCTRPHGSPQ